MARQKTGQLTPHMEITTGIMRVIFNSNYSTDGQIAPLFTHKVSIVKLTCSCKKIKLVFFFVGYFFVKSRGFSMMCLVVM